MSIYVQEEVIYNSCITDTRDLSLIECFGLLTYIHENINNYDSYILSCDPVEKSTSLTIKQRETSTRYIFYPKKENGITIHAIEMGIIREFTLSIDELMDITEMIFSEGDSYE